MSKISLNVLIASVVALGFASGQVLPSRAEVRERRVVQVGQLQNEIAINNHDDQVRVTQEYTDAHLAEIRRVVQQEILDTLNAGGKPEDVTKILSAMLDPRGQHRSFSYATDLNGLGVLVIGYAVFYWGGLPHSTVVIQGYRKAGMDYELGAETGEAFKCCDLQGLVPLHSRNKNETWFLARGSVNGPSQYQERARIYSFDGYEFKELWAPAGAFYAPAYHVDGDTVTVTYWGEHIYAGSCGRCQEKKQDTVQLTPGGPVVTTTTLTPLQ